MIRRIIIQTLILVFLVQIQAFNLLSQSYKIKLNIKGASGIKTQLCYYQGENQYLVQSSVFDKNDKLIFEGEESLLTGIYVIVLENVGSFDLLIKNEQNFSITADKVDIIKTISVKGSNENNLFFDYQKKVLDIKKHISEIDTILTKSIHESDSIKLLNQQRSVLEQKLFSLVAEIKVKNPESYLTKVLILMDASDPDKINYADPDILRTPFYHNLIRLFIKKNINSSAANIISETSKFLESLKVTEANYQYALGYLINFYNTFYKNGINEVFVYLADSYFLPDKAKWLKSEALKQLKERRDFLAQGLPEMPAADLTLESTSGEYFSLLQLESKMTFLYFWSVNCGHCSKSTQVLKDHYDALSEKGIKIFAVNIEKDKEAWIKKVEENELPWINCYDPQETSKYRDKYYVYGSPLLFVIGQNKKILTVKNGEVEIEEFVNQLIK